MTADPADSRVPDRPHWAARAENVKNRQVVRLLRLLRWQVRLQPFHGYGVPGNVRILAKALYAVPSAPADFHDQPVHDMRTMAVRGWRSFTSQVSPYCPVLIRAGNEEFTVRADRSGIIDVVLPITLPPGRHEVSLSTDQGNAVTATVWVVDPETTHGLVSDIDDTVMVTWLPRPLLAFWNAFVIHQSSRRVVPGMPMLYQRFARENPDALIVYLSTGAWNVFPVLQRFLYKNGYPEGPLLLTDWGPTNSGLFRSGIEHKDRSLAELAAMFPAVRWLLVGDDGQHDPQIYTRFAAEHEHQVSAVAIRQLTEYEQVLSHGSRRRGAPWRGFPRRNADRPGGTRAAPRSGPARASRPRHQPHRPAIPRIRSPFAVSPDGHGLLAALRRHGILR